MREKLFQKTEPKLNQRGFGSLDVLKMDIILRLPLKAEHSMTECNHTNSINA